MEPAWESVNRLKGGLIVSCQASPGEPLCSPSHILALALSALNGGACGLRLEGIENIKAVKPKVEVPVVGLIKSALVPDAQRLDQVYITASYEEAAAVAQAGADIIAIDATGRPRPDGLDLQSLIKRIHQELQRPVWADVSTIEEGIKASGCGADVLSTTLAGYTRSTKVESGSGPDFMLLSDLCRACRQPVVMEGRIWQPDEVAQAFSLGAYAVVVGSAITRPQLITKRFVKALPVNQSPDSF